MTNTIEASGLVAALETAWAAIQQRHEDVPAVVVTLGAGSIGVPRGALKLGHFAANRWAGGDSDAVAELFIGGEGLQRGAAAVLVTLLHEAAHGVAHVRGIQDTSRQGRYHNKRFAALGAELGLTITQEQGIGWSGSKLAEGTADEYAAEIEALASAITSYRHIEGMLPSTGTGSEDGDESDGESEDDDQDEAKKRKNGLVLVCECDKPRRIRVSVSTAELGPIGCGVCGEPFKETAD